MIINVESILFCENLDILIYFFQFQDSLMNKVQKNNINYMLFIINVYIYTLSNYYIMKIEKIITNVYIHTHTQFIVAL